MKVKTITACIHEGRNFFHKISQENNVNFICLPSQRNFVLEASYVPVLFVGLKALNIICNHPLRQETKKSKMKDEKERAHYTLDLILCTGKIIISCSTTARYISNTKQLQ